MAFKPLAETVVRFNYNGEPCHVNFYQFDDGLYVGAFSVLASVLGWRDTCGKVNIPPGSHNSAYGHSDVCSAGAVMDHLKTHLNHDDKAALALFRASKWLGVLQDAKAAIATIVKSNKKRKTTEEPTTAADTDSKEEIKEQPKIQRILLVLGSADVDCMKWGIVTDKEFPYTDGAIKELCKDIYERSDKGDKRVHELIDEWYEKLEPMHEAPSLGAVDRVVYLVPKT
jgi:hypothetical protein